MNQIALISKETPRNYFFSFKIVDFDFNSLKKKIVQYFIEHSHSLFKFFNCNNIIIQPLLTENLR